MSFQRLWEQLLKNSEGDIPDPDEMSFRELVELSKKLTPKERNRIMKEALKDFAARLLQ